MTMKVQFDADSRFALGQMNHHVTQAGKALMKIASGQKIVGAKDDPANLAITEQMREQIRSLLQDDQNVQNDSSMVTAAERGISQIVEVIRHLKSLAVNAANDHNTDTDRVIIQKEFDSNLATIDDIVFGTKFNGKILLDGTWRRSVERNLMGGSGGANTKVTDLVAAFKGANNATELQTTTQSGTIKSGYSSLNASWRFELDKSFKASSGSTFSVELDFSSMRAEGPYPYALNGQGFTILCDGCPQYINILFDSSRTAAQSVYDKTTGVAADGSYNDMAREFIIGVKNVRTPDDLAEAIFEGISAVSDEIERKFTSYYRGTATPRASGTTYDKSSSAYANTSDDILVNAAHNLRIQRLTNADGSSKIVLTKTTNQLQFKEGTIPNPLIDEKLPAKIEDDVYNPLWVQHGTESNQRIHVYINSMQAKDLKGNIHNEADMAQLDALSNSPEKKAEFRALLNQAEGMTLADAKVTTREDARVAMRVIDGALEYALDEMTTMGAYLQRMRYMDENIDTMRTNVQSAESGIRDSDIAREMTNYVKYNFLAQASQAILAQANQNKGAVLDLLE